MLLLVESTSKIRIKASIFGVVQGVGFRPFAYKLAKRYNLKGFIFNHSGGVELEVEGDKSSVFEFFIKLEAELPPLAKIENITKEQCPLKNYKDFEIIASVKSSTNTSIPADISICADCLAEMRDIKNRRYNYPFINCTNCGVRYSIINSLPYDRDKTSMKDFTMCKRCYDEYTNPNDRRYHAQPISCFDCGPKLSVLYKDATKEYDNVIDKIVLKIKEGACVAIKGVGGFHLVCDATNDVAIKKLRDAKQRATKPFAVMFDSLTAIKKVVDITDKESSLLLSLERPIVLADKKQTQSISFLVAPNIEKLGVFLPYTPIHILLLERLKSPIIATSANQSSEPIIKDEKEILQKLPFVDAILTYDRDIVHICDDSVVGVVDDREVFYRVARGYTPMSFYINSTKKILALGANQKSTITLAFDNTVVISPYIGNLNSISSVEYFVKVIDDFMNFYNFVPDIVVCDKHPNYESTLWAKEYKKKHNTVELIELQHHYAHSLSVMAEYNLFEKVLSFCFDGTGYGDDGVLWGCEVLLTSVDSYERVYHLKEFSLLGGEKAIKEPYRVALSLLFDIYSKDEILSMKNVVVEKFSKKEIETFYMMHTKGLNSPKTTSLGRMFDAIYAFMGEDSYINYEGESGLVLESYAKCCVLDEVYTFSIGKDGVISFDEMICEILKETDKTIIASKFINTIADMIVKISKQNKELPVILCGGVFQNLTLLKKVIQLFKNENIKYFIQQKTALNDGSISLGQAYYAINLQRNKNG